MLLGLQSYKAPVSSLKAYSIAACTLLSFLTGHEMHLLLLLIKFLHYKGIERVYIIVV
jgi:hypothetical protein